jgi:hypothetical protein
LKSGDKDTKFFHARASQRQGMNKISAIIDEDGITSNMPEGMEEAFVSYFSNLFTSSMPMGMEGVYMGAS